MTTNKRARKDDGEIIDEEQNAAIKAAIEACSTAVASAQYAHGLNKEQGGTKSRKRKDDQSEIVLQVTDSTKEGEIIENEQPLNFSEDNV